MEKSVVSVIVLSILFCCGASLYAETPVKPPEVVTLDSLVDSYESVTFNHSLHAMMAGDCGSCHHQHGDSGSLPCKNCHAVEKSLFKGTVENYFPACRKCHGTYNPAQPKMKGLKTAYHSTCFKCHRGMGNVGIDPKGCTEICHAKKDQ